MSAAADDDGLWDAFGSDDDDDGSSKDEVNGASMDGAAADAVALFLAQSLLKLRPIPLSSRSVAVCQISTSDSAAVDLSVWKAAIEARGIAVHEYVIDENAATGNTKEITPTLFDVVVGVSSASSLSSASSTPIPAAFLEQSRPFLVPGGSLLLVSNEASSATGIIDSLLDASFYWETDADAATATAATTTAQITRTIYSSPERIVVQLVKLPCRIQESTCLWLPAGGHDIPEERRRAAAATVLLSAHERAAHSLHESTVQAAVQTMQDHGFCILPGLLPQDQCLQWGDAVLQDLHEAAAILLKNQQVDLYYPGESGQEPGTYRELSMREDLRLDLRSGPALSQLRGPQGNQPWTVQADTTLDCSKNNGGNFLRGHANVLEIVRRVMYPVDKTLSPGNFGRYNFDGSGPDGSFPDVRVSTVGGIVSLPGSADQAIHADTPHLFEHTAALPAHYINAFTPGSASDDRVGQTAMVPASHRLNVTAKYQAAGQSNAWWKDFVRPRLELGDVLLFDCRIMHFGLANTSATIERPLLYSNMTLHWFQDPKNWDNERPIFGNED
jgi:hypothetical protein